MIPYKDGMNYKVLLFPSGEKRSVLVNQAVPTPF